MGSFSYVGNFLLRLRDTSAKKHLLLSKASFFPNLLFRLGNQQPLRLNTRYGASIERVISRQISIGLSWETVRTQTRYDFNMKTGSAENRR